MFISLNCDLFSQIAITVRYKLRIVRKKSVTTFNFFYFVVETGFLEYKCRIFEAHSKGARGSQDGSPML